MRLQESKKLNENQRRNIAQLELLVEERGLRLTLDEEEDNVLFLGRGDRLICSSPVTDFDYV